MRLGIALSGGGIRGIAHAGVLQALEEKKIKIDAIGGTSSGSMIAILYAMGYSPYHIYILFKRYAKQIAKMNSIPIISGIGNFITTPKAQICGIRSGNSIEELFNNLAKRRNISKINQIKMPIVIPSVDITQSKEYIFTNKIPKNSKDKEKYITDITIGKAIRASSSFPVAFQPCTIDDHIFMDGGVLDNLPVKEVKKHGIDKVIAVKFDADKVDCDSNMMDIVMKITDIMGSKISEENIKLSDLVLDVYTDKVGILDIEKLDKCYKYGYESVINNLDKITSLI